MESFVFNDQVNDAATRRGLQVRSDMQFAWLRRFALTWRDVTDREWCLGDLSADQGDPPPCFLVFGLSESREIVLYLHVQLKINATPRGMRNTYMIVSAESFDTGSAVASTDVLPVIYDPRESPVLSNAGVETGAGLLWARFVFKEPSDVLMPVGKAQKPINERSRGLLLSLRSLSQAKSFELHVRNLGSNSDVMRTFLRELSSGTSRKPEIDYKSTFNGRPWGTNAWKSYRLRDNEKLTGTWNPLLDESPPPYEASIQSVPEPSENASTSISDSKGNDRGRGEGASQETSTAQEHSEASEGLRDSHEAVETREGGEGREDSQETIALQDQTLQDDSGHIRAGYEAQEEPDRLRKRSAREARLDAEPDSNAIPRPSNKRRPKVQRGISFAIQNTQASEREAATDEQSPYQRAFEGEPERILKERALYHSTSVLARGPNRGLFDDTQFRWFCDATLWLGTVWRRDHSVPAVYLKKLHKLCGAIRAKDRRAFESIRIRCMALFAQQEQTPQDVGSFACALADRTRWMVDLIYHEFGPGHDTLVIDELTALHQAARRWVEVGGDTAPTRPETGKEYIRREDGFYLQMAACLLVACYKWQPQEHDTVEQDEHRVMTVGTTAIEPRRQAESSRAHSAGR